MGIFGNDDQQNERLDAIELKMRRMTEQISQLSIDLGVTRMELLKARVAVDDAISAADVDPIFGRLNEELKEARATLEASQAAADDAWVTLQDSNDDALETLRAGFDNAWSTLNEANSK